MQLTKHGTNTTEFGEYYFLFADRTNKSSAISFSSILVPRGRASFGQHQEITTSGLVQRHSVFEWLCEHNRLKPEPIRFVRLDSEHAQSDGKSVNRGLPVLDQARGRDFLVLTKRSAASGDENVFRLISSYMRSRD